jgi:hypothetical protein
MYTSYTLYQAERVKTAREQREDDVRAGQLAAAFAQLRHSPRRHRADRQRRLLRSAQTAPARAASSAVGRPACPSMNLVNEHGQCVAAKL